MGFYITYSFYNIDKELPSIGSIITIYTYVNIALSALCKILSVASIVLKLFVLVKNKALHRLLLIALMIPGVFYILSIPVSIIFQVVVSLLDQTASGLPGVISNIYGILSNCLSQVIAFIVDIIYIIYLAFAMKKAKEKEEVSAGIVLGIPLYVASCILTFLFLVINFIVFKFI